MENSASAAKVRKIIRGFNTEEEILFVKISQAQKGLDLGIWRNDICGFVPVKSILPNDSAK